MAHVRDIMSRGVVTILLGKPALEAARMLRDKDISFLVTMDGERPAGVLTERDIVRKIAAEDGMSSRVTVDQIHTETFLSVDPSTRIEVAVQKMLNSNVRRLVVLEGGRLVGVITQTDLASFLRSRLLINGTITRTES